VPPSYCASFRAARMLATISSARLRPSSTPSSVALSPCIRYELSGTIFAKMPKPATYITFRELFDRLPTKEELNATMKGLNAFNTVLLTSRLNTMFRHSMWTKNPQDVNSIEKFQRWFALVFFDQETKQRLESRFGEQNPLRRPVCHPLQLLNVMRLALCVSEGDDSARPDTAQPYTHQLGTASLMVNDLFLTAQEQENLKVGSNDDRRKQLMLQWLPSIEISNPTPLRNLLFRSFGTYGIALRDPQLLARIRKECGGLNIEHDFEALLRIPLMGWLSLVFGVQSLFLIRTQEEFMNKPELFLTNRRTILQDSNLTQSQIDSFFDMLSMSFDELRLEMQKERPVDERLDIVPFKSKPFFATSVDNYACVDLGLLTEKLHNGPYFLLSNKMPEKERWKVFNAWGLVFEFYVSWLLTSLSGRHAAVLYPDTCWEDDKRKAFDALFVKKRMVAVMEFKGGFLPQDARYSNDLDTFMDALQTRIGAGCRQLARDIAAWFPENGEGRKLLDVTVPSNTLFVLPVLVVQDLMLRTPFINYFLNQRFQSERTSFPVKHGIEVLPLSVVQITQLENLIEMAEAFDLDVMNFLHRRCQLDREMLGELQDFISAIPEAKQGRCSPRFQEIFEKSNDEMCAILFREGKGRQAGHKGSQHL